MCKSMHRVALGLCLCVCFVRLQIVLDPHKTNKALQIDASFLTPLLSSEIDFFWFPAGPPGSVALPLCSYFFPVMTRKTLLMQDDLEMLMCCPHVPCSIPMGKDGSFDLLKWFQFFILTVD